MLLQVLDDGRLTDGQGKTVDFKNTLIIMTSNLGADALANDDSGDISDAARQSVDAAIRAHFRPEFLNRIDETVFFKRLGRGEIDRIVDIQVDRLARLLSDRQITIELDQEAKTWLAGRGYDPIYGARPLKRLIQRELQDPLARLILEGKIKDGETVKVSAEDGMLEIGGMPTAMVKGERAVS